MFTYTVHTLKMIYWHKYELQFAWVLEASPVSPGLITLNLNLGLIQSLRWLNEDENIIICCEKLFVPFLVSYFWSVFFVCLFVLHICQTNLVLDKDNLSNYIKVKVLPYEVFK